MDKSIDGLVIRRSGNANRKIGFDDKKKKPAKKVVKKPVGAPVKKSSPEKRTRAINDVAPSKAEKNRAREGFLEPVKSFDFDLTSEDMKKESKKQKKEKKEKKKHSKKHKILIAVLIFFLLLIGGVVWLFIWGNDILARITGGNSNIWDAIGSLVSETYEPLKTDENGRTNILALGTSGYDMGGSGHDGAQLTDSIMIISIDQENGDVAMTSLPRDLKAGATCTATGKINEVYWCNNQYGDDEEAGATAAMEKVGEILGIDFQYYAHVNWGALVTVVDTIGGITVTLDEDISDYNYTHAVVPAGVPTELNGAEALGLARARHGTAGGDFSRGTSQQKILIAIKDKIKAQGLGITDAINIMNSLGDNLRTNFTIEEMKTGAHLLDEFDFDNIRQIPMVDWSRGISYMTTANINGISYVVPSAGIGNYSQLQAYIAQQLISDPVLREEANVLVLNGTDGAGVAAECKEKLEKANFSVGGTDDSPIPIEQKGYHIYLLNDEMSASFKALEKTLSASDVYTHNADELPAGVNTYGYDIVVIVGGTTTTE
ncbi:LCP family protein [Candidatus Saccharibacteria bacterium]|nr:LCP family protein [Candidatus Saccharibacteria bacterium]